MLAALDTIGDALSAEEYVLSCMEGMDVRYMYSVPALYRNISSLLEVTAAGADPGFFKGGGGTHL